MYNLKQIVGAATLTVMVFIAVIYTSCGKKPQCENINCQYGLCNEGKCICYYGYTGTLCETNETPCNGVNCMNGGVCNGGQCTCPTGTTGSNCETVIRDTYLNTYAGNGYDNATPRKNYSNVRMVFSYFSGNYSQMELRVEHSAGGGNIGIFHVTISSFTDTGSSFIITPINGGVVYSGHGTVSATKASMVLTVSNYAAGEEYILTLPDMHKE